MIARHIARATRRADVVTIPHLLAECHGKTAEMREQVDTSFGRPYEDVCPVGPATAVDAGDNARTTQSPYDRDS